jgi:hypothetical protein
MRCKLKIEENNGLEKWSRKAGVRAYKENPFWEPTEIKLGSRHIRVAGGRHVSNDGESVEHSGVHIVRHVDREEFVKLYTKNMKLIFDLPPRGLKLLHAVLYAIQQNPNADAIYLPWFEVSEFCSEHDIKMSQTTFHRAMRDLLARGFLAEALAPNKYWINPHLFFNGDRMTFINEYRIKSEGCKNDPT